MCLRRLREGKDTLRLHTNTIVFNICKQFTQTFLAHISRIKGRKVCVLRKIDDGVEFLKEPLPAELPRTAQDTAAPEMLHAVFDGRGSDQIKDTVILLLSIEYPVRLGHNIAVSCHVQLLSHLRTPCRPNNAHLRKLCTQETQKCNADTTCSAAYKHDIAIGYTQILQRAERRIIRLRNCRKDFPREFTVHRINLFIRQERILRIAAVKGASHLPHERDDTLPHRQTICICRFLDRPHTFDAENTRKGDGRRKPLPRKDLRVIHSERSHTHK